MLVRSISSDSLSTSYKLPTRCHVRTAGFNSGSREHPHHSSPLYLPFIEIRTRRTRTCCLRDVARPDEFKGMKRARQEKIEFKGILYVVKCRIGRKETCKLCLRYLQHDLQNSPWWRRWDVPNPFLVDTNLILNTIKHLKHYAHGYSKNEKI